jgi:selenocysteine lyase/cysteine desulfurase
VDAVHYAPHGSLDVRALDTDFLVCSVYKWFGPHLGALYGKAAILDRLPAYKVRPAHDRYETGTPSFEAYAGTLAAVGYLRDLGRAYGDSSDGAGSGEARGELVAAMRAVARYERQLGGRMLDGLHAIPGVHVWGIADPARLDERTPTFAVTLDGISPADAAAELGRAGIFTWNGDFYARALIERLGTYERGGVLRLGLVHYSTAAEVDRTLAALAHLAAGATAGSRSSAG